jgi:putative ABC transport system permease protein
MAEVALALALLTGAGLLMKSFSRLQSVSPGFAAENLITFNMFLPVTRYPTQDVRNQFFNRVIEAVATTPGVTAAASTSVMPFGGGWSTGSFNVEGFTPPPEQNRPWGDIRIVSPGFQETMGIPLLKGRFFSESDVVNSPLVVVVDEELVDRYWPGQDPIGKRISRGDPTNPQTVWFEVIGVVGHTAHEGLDADRRVQLYFSYRQLGNNRNLGFIGVIARTARSPETMVNAVRQAVRSVDPDMPVANVRTMEELIAQSVGDRRITMTLLAVFAALALGLASLGIYGVMSYLVTQRSQEIGVRIALGASMSTVLGLVMKQGIALIGLGVVFGVLGSIALTYAARSQLFGLPFWDPATYALVVMAIVAVALAATYLPARRAARLDPVHALRQE